VTRNYDFIKPPQIRFGLGRLLGIGVLLAEGDDHKTQRKNLMPAFAFRHIKEIYPIFFRKSRELVECVTEFQASNPEGTPHPARTAKDTSPEHVKGSIELGGWFSRATLDIIGVSGMGQDFNSLRNPNNKLAQTYQMVLNPPRSARLLQIAGAFISRKHRMVEVKTHILTDCPYL
jgi:cytochrome P450